MHQPCNEPCSIAITSYNRLESCMLGSLAEAALHTGKNDSEYHMQVSRGGSGKTWACLNARQR